LGITEYYPERVLPRRSEADLKIIRIYGMAARYGINRLIDSRNCYELIQRGFVIPKSKAGISNSNPEHIRTVEQIVSRDKGSMIISPQTGLHENVISLDYES
jgi:DNA polymerase elongation subunit (family B)